MNEWNMNIKQQFWVKCRLFKQVIIKENMRAK